MSLANSTPPTRTSSTRLRKPSPGPLTYPANSSSRPRPHHHHFYSLHWLFRSNIPRRRRSLLPVDVHKRNFFGMGEILGVLTNPAETVRSLTESRRLLDEARREINEGRERSQIPTKHTFSRLPGYFPRVAEAHALEHVLQGDPSFTVLFGASSVGKTALLREVLSNDNYHVLHFDLRIAGFADLASLYFSLSHQMEQYFEEIAENMPGYERFEKESWAFKHDRLNVERRVSESSSSGGKIKTSDIARLMELFQSSLLKYWQFTPSDTDDTTSSSNSATGRRRQSSDDASTRTKVDRSPDSSQGNSKSRWWFGKRKVNANDVDKEQQSSRMREKEKACKQPRKKIPVLFFDEAHKLPTLIQSMEAMKCLLDSMLVLTKQDRLCHVIHATSDPFYQTWLRQVNVMQHCKVRPSLLGLLDALGDFNPHLKIITIGDCSKAETRIFFHERILPRVPERLRSRLDFAMLYEAFGGKLAHWQDYVSDFVNANGHLEIKQSSHFLQAHSMLNLHIIHSSQSSRPPPAHPDPPSAGGANVPATRRLTTNLDDPIHPGLGPAGFRIYTPPTNQSAVAMTGVSDDRATAMVAGYYEADFTAMQLLKVMSRLTQSGVGYLSYFLLCREMGVRAVDGMIRGKVLDLRWTETVTREGVDGVGDATPMNVGGTGGNSSSGIGGGVGRPTAAQMSANPRISGLITEGDSALGLAPAQRLSGVPGGSGAGGAAITEEGDMIAISPGDVAHVLADEDDLAPEYSDGESVEEAADVFGPKLVATTPIMRYAMREVVSEYEDEHSTSEYASLTDVDEY